MITLLIADDHQILLDGYVSIFEDIDDIQVIGTVKNGKQVLDFVAQRSPDVVLLDINMPVLNGVETCKKLSLDFPNVLVIILSMYNQTSYYNRVLQYGGKGYLLKDDHAEEIVYAIRQVVKGEVYVSSKMQMALGGDGKSGRMESLHSDISDRELEVLKEIANGLTDQKIGEKLFISHHTVNSHRKSLFNKLGAHNAAQLIWIATEKGLI